jgi:hypothetical protein
VVADVHPAGRPRRQRSARWKARDGVELSLELAQPAQYLGPDPRNLAHPLQGGTQDPVFGDVLAELVVGHLQRHQHAGPAGDLVRNPDSALDRPERLVHGAVALEDTAPQRPLGQLGQGLSQRAPQLALLDGRHGVGAETLLTRVAEQEQEPAEPQPVLGPDVQLYRGSPHRAHLAHRLNPVEPHAHRRRFGQAAGVQEGSAGRVQPFHDAPGQFVQHQVPDGSTRVSGLQGVPATCPARSALRAAPGSAGRGSAPRAGASARTSRSGAARPGSGQQVS